MTIVDNRDDKPDDFNFHITNFPFLSNTIPSSPAYGFFISQLIRYASVCSSYDCFILRVVRLSNKRLGQGYVKERLRSYPRKFNGWYGDLIKQYEAPYPECYTTFWMMTIYSDALHWSGITPFVDPVTDLDLISEFDCFTSLREVSIEHFQGVRLGNRGRLLRTPGSVPFWELQVFLCWYQSLLNLSSFRIFDRKEEIWLSPMTNAHKHTET